MNIKRNSIDAELVKQYQSGDTKALSKLVKRWHRKFCEKSYWIIKDKDIAKDIAQDSWRAVIKSIDKLQEAEKFEAWALRIVYFKSIDYLKDSIKERARQQDIFYSKQTDEVTENTTNDPSLKEALLRAVSELKAHQQTVIKLFYVEEYSLKEISELLNISIGTTKSRLFHAREKLKTILKTHKR